MKKLRIIVTASKIAGWFRSRKPLVGGPILAVLISMFYETGNKQATEVGREEKIRNLSKE